MISFDWPYFGYRAQNSVRDHLRISVRESLEAPGWANLITLLSDPPYHSFIGEVETLNTTTIRRLTPSCRHQHAVTNF